MTKSCIRLAPKKRRKKRDSTKQPYIRVPSRDDKHHVRYFDRSLP